jgi:hypothetical protein
MRPHPKRARTDPESPRAWATDDRSGFIVNHEDMEWEVDWRGTQLERDGLLVAPDFIDEPQPQLRTLILPEDPPPILNARPEPYHIDAAPPLLTAEAGDNPAGPTVALAVEGFVTNPLGILIADGDT